MKKHAIARRIDVVLQPHSGHTRPDTDPRHAPGPGGEMLLTDVSAQPASPHHCRRKSVSHSAPRLASPGSVTWSPTPASAVPPGQRDTIQPRVRGQAIAGPAPPVPPSGPGRNHRTSWGPEAPARGGEGSWLEISARRGGSRRHSHGRADTHQPPRTSVRPPHAAIPPNGGTPMKTNVMFLKIFIGGGYRRARSRVRCYQARGPGGCPGRPGPVTGSRREPAPPTPSEDKYPAPADQGT